MGTCDNELDTMGLRASALNRRVFAGINQKIQNEWYLILDSKVGQPLIEDVGYSKNAANIITSLSVQVRNF